MREEVGGSGGTRSWWCGGDSERTKNIILFNSSSLYTLRLLVEGGMLRVCGMTVGDVSGWLTGQLGRDVEVGMR